MEDKSTLALYKSLKLTRNLINISFFIIFLVLLFWGNYNPAAAFTLIFYNALHWLLLSNLKSNYNPKKDSDNGIIELTVLKFTFTAGILLHLVLCYGFLYKLPIKIATLRPLPLALTAAISFYFLYFHQDEDKQKVGHQFALPSFLLSASSFE